MLAPAVVFNPFVLLFFVRVRFYNYRGRALPARLLKAKCASIACFWGFGSALRRHLTLGHQGSVPIPRKEPRPLTHISPRGDELPVKKSITNTF